MSDDCKMHGIPWDEDPARTLSYAGVAPPWYSPASIHSQGMVEVPVPEDYEQRDDWHVVRMSGGPHDGQNHYMPERAGAWICGDCLRIYR